jgi:hypothetical protein
MWIPITEDALAEYRRIYESYGPCRECGQSKGCRYDCRKYLSKYTESRFDADLEDRLAAFEADLYDDPWCPGAQFHRLAADLIRSRNDGGIE